MCQDLTSFILEISSQVGFTQQYQYNLNTVMIQAKLLDLLFKLGFTLESWRAQRFWLGSVGVVFQLLTLAGWALTRTMGWQMIEQGMGASVAVMVGGVLVLGGVIGCGVTQWIVYRQTGVLRQHKNIEKITKVALLVIFIILEALYYMLGLYPFYILSVLETGDVSVAFRVFGAICCLILLSIQTVIMPSQRMFGLAGLILIPTGVMFTLWVWELFLGSLSLLFLLTEKNLFKRIAYAMSLAMAIWSLLQIFAYNNKSPEKEPTLNLLNLGLMFSFILGIMGFQSQYNINMSPIEQNELLLNYYKGMGERKEDRKKKMTWKEQQLIDSFWNERKRMGERSSSDKEYQKPLKTWTKQELGAVLWQKVKWTREHHPSFEATLHYFQIGFILSSQSWSLFREMTTYFEQNPPQNLYQRFKVYCTVQEAVRLYTRPPSLENTIDIADIIEAETNYSQFYTEINELVCVMVKYWELLLLRSCVVGERMEELMCIILERREEARRNLMKLDGFHCREQHKVMRMMDRMIDGYADVVDKGEEEGASCDYIILAHKKMIRVGLGLLKQLNYRGQELLDRQIGQILPQNLSGYIQQMQKNFLEENCHTEEQSSNQQPEKPEQVKAILPLVDVHGKMRLYQCGIHMVPSTTADFSYLLSLTAYSDKQAFLLDMSTERILLINEEFSKVMDEGENVMKQLRECETTLLLCDFFDIEEDSVFQLKSMVPVRTNVTAQPGSVFELSCTSMMGCLTTLIPEKQYSFGSNSYLLVLVDSSVIKKQSEWSFDPCQSFMHAPATLKQRHEGETFFCKIDNPYKSKIVERLSSKQAGGCRSGVVWLGVLLVVMFLVVVGQVFMGNNWASQRHQLGQKLSKNMLEYSKQYVCLLRMYTGQFTQQFLRQYWNDTQAYLDHIAADQNPQVETLLDYYTEQNQINSGMMKTTYLMFKDIDHHEHDSYDLHYPEFSLNSSTVLTTFYDFITLMEEGVGNQKDMEFLSLNQDAVMDLASVFLQSGNYVSDFRKGFEQTWVIMLALLGFGAVLVIVALALTAKMVQHYRLFHKLYKFFEGKDIVRLIDHLKKAKSKLGYIGERNREVQKKDVTMTRQQQKVTMLQLKKLEQEEQAKLNAKEESNNALINEPMPASKPNGPIEFTEESRNRYKEGLGKFIVRMLRLSWVSGLFMVVLGGLVYWEYRSMEKEVEEYQSILQLLENIYTDQIWIEQSFVLLFSAHYKNQTTGTITPDLTGASRMNVLENITKNNFKVDGLPQAFQQNLVGSIDFCDTNSDSQLSPSGILYFQDSIPICNPPYRETPVIKTYPQVFQLYSSAIRYMLDRGIDNYLNTSSNVTYTFSDVLISQRQLVKFLTLKKENYQRNLIEYQKQLGKDDDRIYLYLGCMLLALCVLMVANVMSVQKTGRVAVSMICLIPPKVMYKIKMTNFMRRHQVLEIISNL